MNITPSSYHINNNNINNNISNNINNKISNNLNKSSSQFNSYKYNDKINVEEED